MRSRILGAAAIAAALVLVPTVAYAGGSDAPTPYTVTAQTLTLPAGDTFEKNGHINYRMTKLDGSGSREFNVHQAVPDNGQWPRGEYIGKSVYTWTDHPRYAPADFPGGYCITWVQISAYNEHFGEGKQEPVCTTPPVEPTTPPVEPTTPPVEPTTPPVEPTTPPVEPTTPPVEPTTPPVEPTTPPVEPTTPPVEPTPPVVDPDPTTPPVVVPDPTDPVDVVLVDPTTPPLVDPQPPVITEVLAAQPTDATANDGVLAATGSSVAALGVLGLVGLALGTLLVAVRRRGASS